MNSRWGRMLNQEGVSESLRRRDGNTLHLDLTWGHMGYLYHQIRYLGFMLCCRYIVPHLKYLLATNIRILSQYQIARLLYSLVRSSSYFFWNINMWLQIDFPGITLIIQLPWWLWHGPLRPEGSCSRAWTQAPCDPDSRSGLAVHWLAMWPWAHYPKLLSLGLFI